VNELIAQITAQSGAVLAMAKRAVLAGWGFLCATACAIREHFLNELYRLEDSQEGVRALVEKRKPH